MSPSDCLSCLPWQFLLRKGTQPSGDVSPGKIRRIASEDRIGKSVLLEKVRSRLLAQGYTRQDLREVFDEFDWNSSGKMELYQFMKVIKTAHIWSMSAVKCRQLFHYFDADGDGVINFSDFAATLYPELPAHDHEKAHEDAQLEAQEEAESQRGADARREAEEAERTAQEEAERRAQEEAERQAARQAEEKVADNIVCRKPLNMANKPFLSMDSLCSTNIADDDTADRKKEQEEDPDWSDVYSADDRIMAA